MGTSIGVAFELQEEGMPSNINVISRVTPMETNLKFLWSLDYRGESNVELILTN
jgi:hypothetical protein